MVGFYGGDPLESAVIGQQGTFAVPASTGEVLAGAFGQGMAANLFPRALRAQERFTAAPMAGLEPSPVWAPEPDSGIIGDLAARDAESASEPLLDPETANTEFGIKGVLSFDKPVPRAVARDLYEHKREQIEREDVIARREGGLLTGGAARFTANIAAGLLDPINLASGFIPFVGEARVAQALGRGAVAAMGTGERAGVRALTGAGQGALAMTALQPLEFALSRQEHEDYTMADALRSVALGTVLGGGLHAGAGAALDRATGRYRNPMTQAVEDAGPEARETLLQGALAQTIEGRPVDVAPVLALADEWRPTSLGEGIAWVDGKLTRIESPPPGEAEGRPVDVAPVSANFTFERETPSGPIERTSNVHSIRDRDGNEVARATFSFNEAGDRAHIQYIDTAADGEPGRLLGPSTMREIGRSFFQTYPEVEQLSGQRVSGARLARDMNDSADTVTVTRDQLLRDRRGDVSEMLSAARREPFDEALTRAADDAVTARQSDELQALHKQIEDLERQTMPAEQIEQPQAQGAEARPAQVEQTATQVARDVGDARASAVERAAFCITRGGG